MFDRWDWSLIAKIMHLIPHSPGIYIEDIAIICNLAEAEIVELLDVFNRHYNIFSVDNNMVMLLPQIQYLDYNRMNKYLATYNIALQYDIVTTTTNDMVEGLEARQLGIAEYMYAGYGRGNNSWQNEFASDITMTLKYPASIDNVTGLSVKLGLVLQKALRNYFIDSQLDIKFKWPNDLYIGDKKLSGILVKQYHGLDNSYSIVGIGINVNSMPGDFISLKQVIKHYIDRTDLLLCILDRVIQSLSEPSGEILSFYDKDNDYLYFKTIKINDGDKVLIGECYGINAKGELLVQHDAKMLSFIDGSPILCYE